MVNLIYEIKKLNKLVQLKFAIIETKLNILESVDSASNTSAATLLTAKVADAHTAYLYSLSPSFTNPSEIV
jgi:hypothetical protein